MVERTEEDAESGIVRVVMGGRPYTLPVLTIEQSEEWQAALAHQIVGLDTPERPEDAEGEAQMRAVLGQSHRAKMTTLAAYDHTDVLGGEAGIRSKMSQRELADAIDTIVEAEYPLEEDARRSVVEAFGLPLRIMGAYLELAVENVSTSANSANGRSPTGGSPTPRSASNGRPSNSTSGGRTRSGGVPASTKTT